MLNPKKIELEQWGPIDGRPLYPGFWYGPIAGRGMKPYGGRWSPSVGLHENGDKLTWWWNKKSLNRDGYKFIRLWLLSDKKWVFLINKQKRLIQQIRNLSKFVSEPVLEKMPEKKFKRLILERYLIIDQLWSLTLVIETINYASSSYLKHLLKGTMSTQDMENALEVLLSPERFSFHQQSEEELLKILLQKKNKNFERLARRFATEWYWVDNSYYESINLTAQDFVKKYKNWSNEKLSDRLKNISQYTANIKSKKQRVIKKYKIQNYVVKIAKKLSESIWWQDYRKGLIWWTNSITDILSKYACKKYHLKFDDLMFYVGEEWLDLLLKGKVLNPKVISARKKIVVMDTENFPYKIIIGRRARKIARAFKESGRIGHSTKSAEVSGVAVSVKSKNIKGRVRILFSPKEAGRFKRGEILVAPMTSPDYINVMRLAKAIITDHGGLMSHAAVVARELGVPCIVGTKIATKVFKDGELVEVDANKGIVRKVKS